MITNDGRNIVAKFLLGQAPEFASYIAAGCGSKPILTSASASISADKQVMDFEVFRVPITSKGFIRQDGEEKLILKAEMPTEQRYIITEVAFFSGADNAIAGNYDSRNLASIVPSENWLYVTSGITNSITYITTNIDSDNSNSDLNAILSSSPAFFVNSNQTIFNDQNRQNRYEPPRFYNRALVVNGNSASIDSIFGIGASATSIENSTLAFDLSRNLPGDEIKLAISLLSRLSNNNSSPNAVRIVLDFVNNLAGETLPPKARVKISLQGSEFTGNRYKIITKNISDFELDDGFSWANVNLTRIYCCVDVANVPSNDYFVVLDGLRLENVTIENPIYGMVGYDVVKTSDAQPIIKEENSTNYIEYRFGVGVT
jgi:hypothetical protein